ncbi:MAG: hypothetical protein O2780_07085 [Proteobacteria bacterium]|nr:hypothetical protein [Pseudomonadota bacterium]
MILVSGVVLQAACTTSVVVEGTLPTPLIEKLPIHVGVYYSDSFKNYEHKEVLQAAGNYRIDFGRQNLGFFRNLVEAIFVQVTVLDSPQLSDQQREIIDAVLVPEIVDYQFLVPEISTLSFYEASIEYRLVLNDPDGAGIGEWKVIGYGKAEAAMFGAGEAVGEATMQAIRDGGARIATEVAPEMGEKVGLEKTSI